MAQRARTHRDSTSRRDQSSPNRTNTSRSGGSGSCARSCATKRGRYWRCTGPRAERSTTDDNKLERETTEPQRMKTSLDQSALAEASAALREANQVFARAQIGRASCRERV